MMIGALLGLRIGVHQRGGEARQRMEQAMLGVDRDLVLSNPGAVKLYRMSPQQYAAAVGCSH